MAGGGPIPVREYAEAAELMRHAAELRARLFPARQVQSAALQRTKPIIRKPVETPAPKERTEPKIEQEGFIPPKPVRPQDFEDPKSVTMKSLTAIVADVTGVSALEITSHRRRPLQVKARQILYWLGKNYTGLSLPQIGHRVGRRDHTSALWGIRKVQAVADRLDIEKPACPIAATQLLWAAEWPKVSQ